MNDGDADVAGFVLGHRTGVLTHLARVLTALGSEVTLSVLTMVLVALLILAHRRRDAAYFFAGMAGAAALVLVIKHLVHRARPGSDLRLGPRDSSFSFPSGHTLTTTVFVLMVVMVAWPLLRTARSRTAALAVALALAVAVGASRVYLGYHWVTDVVASLVIGTCWSAVVARQALAPASGAPSRVHDGAASGPSA
jgi:membrane-associated phospholipid phosphatase